MNNAVVYARYSSSSQDPQTIDVQIKYCREYADRYNLNVLDEYLDEARTGRNGNRKGLKKLYADASSEKFQYIIIYMSDRYYRNTLEALMFEADMKKHNVTILYTNEPFVDNTERIDPNQQLQRLIGYVFAEHQSNLYADKIANGLEENAIKFLSTGGQRTLGFRANEDKEFYIDEHEAIIVRKIFEMYVEKHSMADINRYLNSKGFKTVKEMNLIKIVLIKSLLIKDILEHIFLEALNIQIKCLG